MLTSTSGVLLEKAKENDACCLTNSISASEDGSSLRRPLVKGEGGCDEVGLNITFQQWVDYTAFKSSSIDRHGLCFENWNYVVKGILTKISINTRTIKLCEKTSNDFNNLYAFIV